MDNFIYLVFILILVFFFNKHFKKLKTQNNIVLILNLAINSLFFILGWKCVIALLAGFNINLVAKSKSLQI